MQIDSASRVHTIAALNDRLRVQGLGGRIMLTQGVACLNDIRKAQLMRAIRQFSTFTSDNDPHGEHDFLTVEIAGDKYFAKIDYYAPDMEHGSEDPADPKKTIRVMVIMRADEY